MTFQTRGLEETSQRGVEHGKWIRETFGNSSSAVGMDDAGKQVNAKHNADFLMGRNGIKVGIPLMHIILK
jgi:hypothetical protein